MLWLQCFTPINHHNSASHVSESYYVLIHEFTVKCLSISSSTAAAYRPITVAELWHLMIMKGQEKNSSCRSYSSSLSEECILHSFWLCVHISVHHNQQVRTQAIICLWRHCLMKTQMCTNTCMHTHRHWPSRFFFFLHFRVSLYESETLYFLYELDQRTVQWSRDTQTVASVCISELKMTISHISPSVC